MSTSPITLLGAERLREELRQLKSEARPKVIADIADARAHGDLKENAEYHAAREQQGFIEGRIQTLEAALSNAQIIDVSKLAANGRVVFGATVHVADANSGDEMTYRIVGDEESDVKSGAIAVSSPMARALIGKEEGDIAEVQAPGGTRELEITGVEYI